MFDFNLKSRKEEKMPRATLSIKVLERFLSQEQVNDLLKNYSTNVRIGGYNIDRREALSQEIKLEEREALNLYLKNTPMSELKDKLGLTTTTGIKTRLGNIALKLLFQQENF